MDGRFIADERVIERFPGEGELTTTIVEAVADATGINSLKLDTRLYDVVDPDGLEQVFRKRGDGTIRTGGKLTFTIAECKVVVHSEGRVVVSPP